MLHFVAYCGLHIQHAAFEVVMQRHIDIFKLAFNIYHNAHYVNLYICSADDRGCGNPNQKPYINKPIYQK